MHHRTFENLLSILMNFYYTWKPHVCLVLAFKLKSQYITHTVYFISREMIR